MFRLSHSKSMQIKSAQPQPKPCKSSTLSNKKKQQVKVYEEEVQLPLPPKAAELLGISSPTCNSSPASRGQQSLIKGSKKGKHRSKPVIVAPTSPTLSSKSLQPKKQNSSKVYTEDVSPPLPHGAVEVPGFVSPLENAFTSKSLQSLTSSPSEGRDRPNTNIVAPTPPIVSYKILPPKKDNNYFQLSGELGKKRTSVQEHVQKPEFVNARRSLPTEPEMTMMVDKSKTFAGSNSSINVTEHVRAAKDKKIVPHTLSSSMACCPPYRSPVCPPSYSSKKKSIKLGNNYSKPMIETGPFEQAKTPCYSAKSDNPPTQVKHAITDIPLRRKEAVDFTSSKPTSDMSVRAHQQNIAAANQKRANMKGRPLPLSPRQNISLSDALNPQKTTSCVNITHAPPYSVPHQSSSPHYDTLPRTMHSSMKTQMEPVSSQSTGTLHPFHSNPRYRNSCYKEEGHQNSKPYYRVPLNKSHQTQTMRYPHYIYTDQLRIARHGCSLPKPDTELHYSEPYIFTDVANRQFPSIHQLTLLKQKPKVPSQPKEKVGNMHEPKGSVDDDDNDVDDYVTMQGGCSIVNSEYMSVITHSTDDQIYTNVELLSP